jgi:hypothetical protein
MDFSYDFGWLYWRIQIRACLHAKKSAQTYSFVELVYDSQMLQFMGKVSCGILMEDGAPMHHSRAPKEWRKLCLTEKLDWPANSPDLNPLQNVWVDWPTNSPDLKDAIQHSQTCPRNLEELKMTLQREWRSICSIKLRNLCHSMLARSQSVIEAKGGHTCWQICNKSILIDLYVIKHSIHVINS